MTRVARAALPFALATAVTLAAGAQPRVPTTGRHFPAPRPSVRAPSGEPAPDEADEAAPGNVRAHVGADYASKLLSSPEAEERTRGIERAASVGSPEAVALLVRAAEGRSAARTDPGARIVLARALAQFADQEQVQDALVALVRAGDPARSSRPSDGEDVSEAAEGDPSARAELAREIAAVAIARRGDKRSLEQLLSIARRDGNGRRAALLALSTEPPRDPSFFATSGAALSAPVIAMLGELGDLRALKVLHDAMRSSDVTVRAEALRALARLGDRRAVALAKKAIADRDTRLRAAGGEALVLLGAPERIKVVAALLDDEATVAVGLRLAARVPSRELTSRLAARARRHRSREIRSAALRALGRSTDPAAARTLALADVVGDAALGYEAALALARSPAPNATELVAGLASNARTRGLGVRAYVVRALVLGERSSAVDEITRRMSRARAPDERALGALAQVALGEAEASDFLSDADARVRRAAAMGVLAHPTRDAERALLARARIEKDEATRQVLGVGLLSGDPDGLLTTTSLVDRAESGGPSAPLAAYALARRADDTIARKVSELLASRDPLVRAHTARGLAAATLPDASGRLADAYKYETDVGVRRAIVAALAARTQDRGAPVREATLRLAAELEPDGPTRRIARLARKANHERASAVQGPAALHEVAWLRLVSAEHGAPSGAPFTGALLESSGVAVPIAFDAQGYALVPGVSPGLARLVLAPKLPSYDASAR